MPRAVRWFPLVFAVYTSAAVFLLLLGLVGELAEAVPPLRLQLEVLALGGDLVAPLANAMRSAGLSPTPAPQVALDYAVSALNLAFGLFLVWRLPGQRVAQLLGLGMVGAATSFNAHAHSALLSNSLAYSTGLNDLHLALHVVSGAAYLYALLLFPDGALEPPGADWLVAGIMGVAVGSILIFHTDVLFFVAFFGFLIPVAGLLSLAARLRRTAEPRTRQQIGIVAWALALVLLATAVLLVLVFGPRTVGRTDVVAVTPDQVEYVALELFSVLFALVPIALFVGIVRYQLFGRASGRCPCPARGRPAAGARPPADWARHPGLELRAADGCVSRAKANSLHPWLKAELLQVLADLPPTDSQPPAAAQWATWLGHVPYWPLPPLRLILIWDNLAGRLGWPIVKWLFAHGVMPLYTPLSGSWLNMAESVQRIICGRALNGQHPTTAAEIITWLEDTVAGWNAAPTGFVWDGKRRERRIRAKQRRLAAPPQFPITS